MSRAGSPAETSPDGQVGHPRDRLGAGVRRHPDAVILGRGFWGSRGRSAVGPSRVVVWATIHMTGGAS
jgi:hypothetical protein